MNKKSNMYFVQLAEFTIIWWIMSNGGDAEAPRRWLRGASASKNMSKMLNIYESIE